MKTHQRFHIFGFIILIILALPLNSIGQYVSLKNNSFIDPAGNKFYSLWCNYMVDFVRDPGVTDPDLFYFAPMNSYGVDWEFDCTDVTSCHSSFDDDFAKIKTMGFNTVHFVISPMYNPDQIDENTSPPVKLNITDDFFIKIKENISPIYSGYILYPVLNSPYSNDVLVTRCLSEMDALVTKAANAGLYVVIDIAGGDFATKDPASTIPVKLIELYKTFAAKFANNSNILAYKLTGEPAYGDNKWLHTKAEICELTSTWYDEIKAIDPNHLITLGSVNYLDLFEWDPAVMKMDFFNPHYYLTYFPYETPYTYTYTDTLGQFGHSIPLAMDRFNAFMYWLQEYCPVPWMPGETGFAANDVFDNSSIDGIYADQSDYIDHTMNTMLNSGSMGYSYWQFQEAKWDGGGPLDRYGLLKSLPLTDPAIDKPAVSVIQTFASASHTPVPLSSPPNNYYTSYHQDIFSQNINTITGTVKDQNGNPIGGALIQGTAAINLPQDASIHFDVYTFSNDLGEYSITPFNYIHSEVIYQYFHTMKVTCAGCETKDEGTWGDVAGDPYITSTTLDFVLKKMSRDINEVIDNEVVTSGNTKNFRGWKSLTALTNVNILDGSASDLKAYEEVNLKDGVFLEHGSNVHIFNDTIQPPCDEIANVGFRYSNPSHNSSFENMEKEIEISFNKSEEKIVSIHPNPSNSIFNVDVNFQDSFSYKLLDLMGHEIGKSSILSLKFNVDMSDFPKGIYFLVISNDKFRITKKIILN